MTSDIIVQEGMFGDNIPFTIYDDNGLPDDLTQYDTVTLKIYTYDYQTSKLVKVLTDVHSNGIANWKPATTNEVPTRGKYFCNIIRTANNVNRPTVSFSMEVQKVAGV